MSSSSPADTARLRSLLLSSLSAAATIADLRAWCAEQKEEYPKVEGVARGLAAAGFVVIQARVQKGVTITQEAEQYVKEGSPEYRLLSLIPAGEDGITPAALQAKARAVEGIPEPEPEPEPQEGEGEGGGQKKKGKKKKKKDHGGVLYKLGFGKAMSKRWIRQDKKKGVVIRGAGIVTAEEQAAAGAESADAVVVTDVLVELLRKIRDAPREESRQAVPAKDLKDLKKRKLLVEVKEANLSVEKGPRFSTTFRKQVGDLTRAMLDGDAWKKVDFRPANIKTFGADLNSGYLHPLMKVRSEFRKILLQMGFEEMPTNQFVESSFWNFDALFQPQSHPARDAHDTFFIKDPAQTRRVPEDYLEIVKKTHEEGGFGSLGYNYKWKRSEAEKNLLRTHTTAISAKMLYRLGQDFRATGEFTPKKYFSIDRVFRNETMDATHLAEFHQVEFFVADRGLTLGHLISLLETFFHKIGITNLRFKPAYNPYTEPSMEIFGFHPDLGRWTEIGNSGMFRPEMLRPMGLPEDVRVIAGGLSLERPTMIKYRVDNIRELFGHKIDLKGTKTSQLPRFF